MDGIASDRRLETPRDLWTLFVRVATAGASGMVATKTEDGGIVLRLGAGRLAGYDGNLADAALAEATVAAGVAPAKTVQRAIRMAKSTGGTIARVLADLGVLEGPEDPRWPPIELEAALFQVLGGEGPWEWRPLGGVEAGELALLPLLARWLTTQDAAELVEWSGRPRRPTFAEAGDGWEQLPEPIRAFLSGLSGEAGLKEVVRTGAVKGREALAWVAIGVVAGWLRPGSGAPTPVEEVEGRKPESTGEEAEPSAVPPTPSTAAEVDGAELAEVVEPVEVAEVAEVVAEAEAEVPSEGTDAAAAGTGAGTPAQRAKAEPFWHRPPPADLFARLGVPRGAVGQAVTQAYSRRFRALQKALAAAPEEPRLQAWREALLDAYRILSHSEAAELYERLGTDHEGEERIRAVRAEMAKRSLTRGINALRQGQLYEGAKALQDALSWRDDLLEAWIALGLYRAAMEEEEEPETAFESFERALALAPEHPQVRYWHGVTAWFTGHRDRFEEDRGWFNAHPDRTPEAWRRFLDEEVERG